MMWHQQNHKDLLIATCPKYPIKCAEKQKPISTQQSFPLVPLWVWLPAHDSWPACCKQRELLLPWWGVQRDCKEQWLHRRHHRFVAWPVSLQRLAGKLCIAALWETEQTKLPAQISSSATTRSSSCSCCLGMLGNSRGFVCVTVFFRRVSVQGNKLEWNLRAQKVA